MAKLSGLKKHLDCSAEERISEFLRRVLVAKYLAKDQPLLLQASEFLMDFVEELDWVPLAGVQPPVGELVAMGSVLLSRAVFSLPAMCFHLKEVGWIYSVQCGAKSQCLRALHDPTRSRAFWMSIVSVSEKEDSRGAARSLSMSTQNED